MGTLFGTDGVRGVANVHPMTAEMAMAIGRTTAYVLKRNHIGLNRILVGKDTRLSGYMLETALTSGICSMGVNVLLTGPLPTPGIAFLTRSMRCVAGIVISASHNPYSDNGIKIFASSGYKLNDHLENEIEHLLQHSELVDICPPASEIGRARRIDDAGGRYIEFCKSTFPGEYDLGGMRIVLDCANGAAHRIAPMIFAELGAEVHTIHAEPNGLNINEACGSQHTQDLSRKVLETQAHIGLAFDGDADRLIAVDETGAELSGDHIIAICARHLKSIGKLRNDLVVLTPMSNLGLRLAFDKMGIRWVDAGVGDRLVLELMKKEDACLGGEQSGHVIFLDKHTTGDGIVTALQLLAVMRREGRSLSDLAGIFQNAPQTLHNINVKEKPPLESMPGVVRETEAAERELGSQGRVLVRYSGTQPMCRVMIEATTQEIAERLAESIATEIRKAIGA
ncbi:MAG: phosphoglucosamine mutase [Kiritimatiellia bacterium]|jgi:phosphoglucosamine mutase